MDSIAPLSNIGRQYFNLELRSKAQLYYHPQISPVAEVNSHITGTSYNVRTAVGTFNASDPRTVRLKPTVSPIGLPWYLTPNNQLRFYCSGIRSGQYFSTLPRSNPTCFFRCKSRDHLSFYRRSDQKGDEINIGYYRIYVKH